MFFNKNVLAYSVAAVLSATALVGCNSDSTDPEATSGISDAEVDAAALALFQEPTAGNHMDIDPAMSGTTLIPTATQVASKTYTAPAGSTSLVDTTYAGAFDPAVAETSQWTYGWTIGIHGNQTVWHPATAGTLAGAAPVADGTCPAGTTDVGDQLMPASVTAGSMDICELPNNVLADLNLTNDNIYQLKAGTALTYIGDGHQAGKDSSNALAVTLTVEQGTLIMGGAGSALVITRNSNIDAVGTAADPIVMTSTQQFQSWADGSDATGAGAHGGWGGLVIHGMAETNSYRCNNTTTCDAVGEGLSGSYGGFDDTDNSGTLKYVVVRNAGQSVGLDDELNVISLYTIGNGTSISYVQAHKGQDDGIELFGGDVNMDHIVITNIQDDNLDWAQGYTGDIQFLVTKQNEDEGDKSMEADNEPKGGHDMAPRSNPTIVNFTMWGFGNYVTGHGNGMNIRVGAAATLSNGIVANLKNCLDVDDAATINHGMLSIKNTFFSCTAAIKEDGK